MQPLGVRRARPRWHAWRSIAVIAALASCAGTEPRAPAWTTYRSDTFGYELSYPPAVRLVVYFEGSSGELQDAATGEPIAELEVWPPGECPRQPPGLTARSLGIERATSVTQADGADGSSWCAEPLTVRESRSSHGVALYELELTCKSERSAHDEGGPTVLTVDGTKGPTYFADISPSWRARILSVDPVGIDPRRSSPRRTADAALVRRIVDTVRTFPAEKPDTVCIEELSGTKKGVKL